MELAESVGLWSVLSDTETSLLLVRVDRRKRVLVSPVVERQLRLAGRRQRWSVLWYSATWGWLQEDKVGQFHVLAPVGVGCEKAELVSSMV